MIEGISEAKFRAYIRRGWVVVPGNRECRQTPIGRPLRTKINANVGTSPDLCDPRYEVKKAKAAQEYGADTIMDLSIGGNLDRIRKELMGNTEIPFGTVPIYQAAREYGIEEMTPDDLFRVIEKHGKDGVDFITVHTAVIRRNVEFARKRLLGIVSRGGAILSKWMSANGKENPLYAQFDYLLELARKYSMTLSLGDGLRPGCVHDAGDKAMLAELKTIARQVKSCRKAGVQCMVEGPGHMPLNMIRENMELEQKLCDGAPYYVLGPLVTDFAPGYDHITSAIGGALAAYYGASLLCYVTPAEHLSLPNLEDVKNGVIASRIAAHAADLARGRDVTMDDSISKARKTLNWKEQMKHSVNPAIIKEFSGRLKARKGKECTMCGKLCAIKLFKETFK